MVGTHVVSTHLPPAKDRSLAAALIRISERRGLQDDFVVEKVVYCGDGEPFSGWANTVPTVRYSDSNRPKDIIELPRKRKPKPKVKHVESRDSLNDVYSELIGMTSRADGHYHASATVQELYDEYKKRQRVEDHTKLKGMVDPVTFRYIPIEERTEDYDSDDETGEKLPVLKMTHANKQAKLLEVLESFMNRKSDDLKGKRTDTERYSVKGRDAASFYDKYKWYFKDGQGNLSRNMKIKKRRGRLGKRKAILGPRSYPSESESEDSSGLRRRPRRHSHPPTYVIQVKDDNSKTLSEETITFERKVDYGLSAPGGPGIDRWVARVVIRDPAVRNEGDTNSASTVSQVTVKTSPSRAQINKMHERGTKQQNVDDKKETRHPEYRLGNRKNKKRNARRLPANFYELYHMSSMETSKVSMKYNVAAGKRQGAIPDSGDSSSGEANIPQQKDKVVNPKRRKIKPTPVHPKKNMESGGQLEPRAQKVLPLSKKTEGVEVPSEETKLPLPPLKSKRPPHHLSDNSSKGSKTKEKPKTQDQSAMQNKDDVALVSHRKLESSEQRQVRTPSSSTFNPDRMFQQMKDTADFITKASALSKANKSIQSSPRFLSHIEDARTGDANSTSKSDSSSRKSLHPKHSKNRAQNKIQQMIDEEKALVSQVIKRLNSTWKEESPDREQTGLVSESVQDALSTAIAKARLSDLQTIGNGLGPSPRSNANQVMKRRVVPPLKDKSSVPTTTVGSDESFFITDSSTFLTTMPKLPAVKPNGIAKKPDPRGSKTVRSLSKDRNETFKGGKSQPGVRFVAEGDLLISKPQTMVPGIFEASISSIKPARRIANVNQVFDIRPRA